MEEINQDFLRFSAYSIKDLITRKLAGSSKFTDQIYEGSNLAILIDIFSHMAQCLLYSLNNTAGESMFSDTQIYENMNRLVKFIGYNPKGVSPATVTLTINQKFLFGNDKPEPKQLAKYSVINVGKSDSRGVPIYYSLINEVTTTTGDEFKTLFYNGRWQKYNVVFTSDGTEYQKIVLEDLKSFSLENQYVADSLINVYVDTNGEFKEYKCKHEGIFTDNNVDNGSYIYKSTEEIFNLRLNENHQYEITFGNGITGKIPLKGAKIHIYYFESNGSDGEIEPYEIKGNVLTHNRGMFGISKEEYQKVFGLHDDQGNIDESGNIMYSSSAQWTNTSRSTEFTPEETVDDIRRNAPEWFKTGNRLVTASDFEYFVKNRFRDNVVDVKCQNNWQYVSTFYQWLYNLGLNGKRLALKQRPSMGTYYLNQNRLQKNDLKYADAADGNNLYLWIKMKNDSDVYRDIIDEEILDIKTLTQEAVYLSPLDLNFSFCAADIDTALSYFTEDGEFDKDNESYLEVTLDDNTLYSNNDILTQVVGIVKQFFNENNFRLGQTVDFSVLANQILNLNSVTRLRTIYVGKDGSSRILNGISFATWTSTIIDVGDDLDISNATRTLEVFQFPKLYRSNDIRSKIKVIRKSISNVNSIQY